MILKPYIALLLVIVFLPITVLAQTPPLASITCQEFWDQFNKAANEDKTEEAKNRIMTEIKNLWDYELIEFKKSYPDLPTATLEEFGQNAFFVMFVYNACEMRPENLPKKVHGNMQKKLYQVSINEKQKAIAKQNDCHIFDPKSMTIFNSTQDGLLYACGPTNFRKATYTIEKDKAGKPSKLKQCVFPAGIEQCQFIEPTKETVCLGEFGICAKNANGKCGWVHTVQSKNCMKSK